MITELKKQFTGIGEVKGFEFTQLCKTDTAYLYEVDINGHKQYEVVKRLVVSVCVDFDKKIYSETEKKETYPKSNRFGVDGWSYQSRKQATKKLLSL